MRTSKWMFTAALLLSVSAAAQQSAESQPLSAAANGPLPTDSQPLSVGSVPQIAGGTASSDSAQASAAPASQPQAQQAQGQQTQAQQTTAPAPTPSALPQPTTMDQVVDRFIEREHGLMKALSNRTPVVETYLQNLTVDPQLGPVPSDDHYFLGRMDMCEP